MRIFVVAAALLLFTQNTFAGFVSYSAWEKLDFGPKSAYAAGSLDTLIIAMNQLGFRDKAAFYNDCLGDKKVTPTQLTESLPKFVAANKQYQQLQFQDVLKYYLISLCGSGPKS